MQHRAADERGEIHARWLIRLRWGAIAGQLVTVALVQLVMGISLPVASLVAVIACEAAVNLFTALALRRGWKPAPRALAGLLVFDLAALTALLHASGGPANPFNFLYLVYLALAVVVLPRGWTWSLVGLSLLLFGLLFFTHRPLAAGGTHHGMSMELHLIGMWVAFGVAAFFITLFVGRAAAELRRREQQLQIAREREHRAEKLASLTTLAAGAAHELATPLSTIALVAKELARELKQEGGTLAEDAALIRSEVERCRTILDQLAVESGQMVGEQTSERSVVALLDEALAPLGRRAEVQRQVAAEIADRGVRLPVRALAQAIRAVVSNALEVSTTQGDAQPVTVAAREHGGQLRIVVSDRGCGMSAEQLQRATEPFFSTKATGRGMGLGLFLAANVVRSLGGSLDIASRPGEGTRVTLQLPWAAPAAGGGSESEP